MDLCDPQDQVIEAAVQRLLPSPVTGKEHMLIGFDTLWLFNIAMENGPFIDDFPIEPSIYRGFSMTMLNNQMVGILILNNRHSHPQVRQGDGKRSSKVSHLAAGWMGRCNDCPCSWRAHWYFQDFQAG